MYEANSLNDQWCRIRARSIGTTDCFQRRLNFCFISTLRENEKGGVIWKGKKSLSWKKGRTSPSDLIGLGVAACSICRGEGKLLFNNNSSKGV